LLDVGCGTGYFSRRLTAQGFEVIALDSDESMLRYARSLNDDFNYLQGDATALPFAKHSVDCCTAKTSLCFVGDPKQAIQEMLRISRKGLVIFRYFGDD
jgi:ubiquinone/menaquinone biosynthesis C-methylase UbiE